MPTANARPFRVPVPAFTDPLRDGLARLAKRPLERALALDALNRLYARVRGPGGARGLFERALDDLRVRVRLSEEDRSRLPATGAAIVVANHPHGLLDPLLLGATLLALRPDVKFLANDLVAGIPELRDLVIGVDVFGGSGAQARNARAQAAALAWLEAGGLLAIFPAGEVSHARTLGGAPTDPRWRAGAARLARQAGAPVVPVHIGGENSALFQLAGLLHPRLRTALLPRELLSKRRRAVELRVGRPVLAARLEACETEAEAIELLRARTYVLADRPAAGAVAAPPATLARPEPIAPAESPATLAAEVDALPSDALLVESGDLAVYCARAGHMPAVVREIGVLRELTFRGVGEGTGKARDLDEHDQDYLHLFVWSRPRRAVIGAYRLGPSDELLRTRGLRGLYTSHLFGFDARLVERLGPSLELGRSFVRPEDQRAHLPLALLWRGIGRYVARHPRYRRLFGAASVSDRYQPASRAMIVSLLETRVDPELARLVRPPRPPRAATGVPAAALRDVDDVSALVAELEPDGRGVPVLVRQYLRLGARVLGCSVDPAFGDSLDALVVVDLANVDRRLLERTIGREEAAAVLGRQSPERLAG